LVLKTTYNNWWASPCGFHNGERTNVLASGLAQCGIIQSQSWLISTLQKKQLAYPLSHFWLVFFWGGNLRLSSRYISREKPWLPVDVPLIQSNY